MDENTTIERLRFMAANDPVHVNKVLFAEAADEIERLTKALDIECQAKEEEIERLRAVLRVLADYSPSKETSSTFWARAYGKVLAIRAFRNVAGKH
jgi:hypothetical protein